MIILMGVVVIIGCVVNNTRVWEGVIHHEDESYSSGSNGVVHLIQGRYDANNTSAFNLGILDSFIHSLTSFYQFMYVICDVIQNDRS
jgi:hypothetical protein